MRKLFIFDLDGVIVNSEPLHEHAKKRILSEEGIEEDLDLSWSVGQPSQILWETLIRRFGLKRTARELEDLQYAHILEEIREKRIPTTPGLEELLSHLESQGMRIGLASSSDQAYVDAVLEHYRLSGTFRYAIGGDRVPRKKPAPDVYEAVLAQAKVLASEAVALEDSAAGSTAAQAAGIPCIGYINPDSGAQDLSRCIGTIRHLEDAAAILEEMDNL
ncbi:HAD family hydrolase [Anaerotalea alkaliphila]|uniref:HAD family phosphatase n=1 Tax=Anaerotalea alkaliphila TaxID=2662126 RepID=A0A7X5KNF2_9FIRM|nr:HAD family phosphatase [Anaerotalea alkaliphila]NDL68809.1 HAD family phosphatase [Anaerotalea alkaliphila]